MHKFDRDGKLYKQRNESYRAILFAIGTICALLFLAGAVMAAQTPKPVSLGQKAPVARVAPLPTVVRLPVKPVDRAPRIAVMVKLGKK